MANNRMYLRCRKCGEILFLGKCYLDGYFYGHYDGESLEQKLNDFYNKHDFCDAPLNKEEIKSLDTPFKQKDSFYNRYEIAYEFEDKENDHWLQAFEYQMEAIKNNSIKPQMEALKVPFTKDTGVKDYIPTKYEKVIHDCIKLLKQEGSDTKQQVLEKLEELVK